jgi:RNA polymerase sigma-70 factor, ECF subfamily
LGRLDFASFLDEWFWDEESLAVDKSQFHERFIADLTRHQDALYAYIFSLVPREDAAADILQETNIVLWRKMEEFRPAMSFIAWACGIARMQVLAQRRDHYRDLLVFDHELVADLAVEAQKFAAEDDTLSLLLSECLKELPKTQRDLLNERYIVGIKLKDLARKLQRSVGGLGVSLFRIRQALAECVERKMREEGTGT